jgi:hypothetical protein
LVIERLDRQEATRATLLHLAVSAILTKDAGTEFRKLIERMNGD